MYVGLLYTFEGIVFLISTCGLVAADFGVLGCNSDVIAADPVDLLFHTTLLHIVHSHAYSCSCMSE